jgi:hypothetical protein
MCGGSSSQPVLQILQATDLPDPLLSFIDKHMSDEAMFRMINKGAGDLNV